MGTDVVTRSFDFARTGANKAETMLTPGAVKTRGVKTLLTLLTPDDPRVEAQPLYLSADEHQGENAGRDLPGDHGQHGLCLGRDTGEELWKTNLGTPINGLASHRYA